ncbi:MAG: GNAT family N-acetyltransferase [Caldilineaceae bacterium]|nr:GNAT family N-acetyltransferase [Caldilineaceae bacterium]
MTLTLCATRVDDGADDWPARLREIRRRLEDRPTLLPHHFLEVVLPKIGGSLFALRDIGAQNRSAESGYAFLLPRDIKGPSAEYTLRYEHVAGHPVARPEEINEAVERALPTGDRTVFYRAAAAPRFKPTHIDIGGVDCGRPDAAEGAVIRAMQQSIWRSAADGLYPSDLYGEEAGTGCSLVARVDGTLAGFLLGFYSFGRLQLEVAPQTGRKELQLESQLLAVAPEQRGRGIGLALKRLQARQTLAAGIERISWTADPLLFANALLNFTRLGAVAYEFQPDLYPFRNELNLVPASRLNLMWPLRSRRVQTALTGAGQTGPREVERDPELTIVNQADGSPVLDAASRRVGIEIPADWVALQRADLTAALRWRDFSNRLLDRYLGLQPGRYVIIGAGVSASRRYLIGERVDDRFLKETIGGTN